MEGKLLLVGVGIAAAGAVFFRTFFGMGTAYADRTFFLLLVYIQSSADNYCCNDRNKYDVFHHGISLLFDLNECCMYF